MSLTRPIRPDLMATRARLAVGAASASGLIAETLAAAAAPVCRNAYLRIFDEGARATAAATDLLQAAGAPARPLAGLAVSVKDLFDIAGVATTAGSLALDDAAPARADCSAVARLRAAGAALIGHTNLSEFAFSGVGINPHHGTPANPATLALDTEPRIPGGSTSGGAVSVAAGAAWAALGSDTGGSIRIPAALQGLVGFKNTQALTPLQGTVPLSSSLDTACALTLSVRDAVLMHEILAARRVHLRGRPVSALRLAVATTTMLDGLDATVARAFERSLAALRSAGAQIDEIVLPEIGELPALLGGGGLPAAESWAWHRERLARRGADYDPRVALRIRRGALMSAADYIDLLHARSDWIQRVDGALAPFDAVLSPTVPIVAPPIAPLLHDDAAFFAVNGALLRNTVVVNFLDGCALSLPCHAADELPVGLMVWHSTLQDDGVLEVSLAIERLLTGGSRA